MASNVFVYQIMYGIIGLILALAFFFNLMIIAKHKRQKPLSEIFMIGGLLLLILETLIILIPLPATNENMHLITMGKLILKAFAFSAIGASLFLRLKAMGHAKIVHTKK
jgi:hypothetical protein